MSKQVKDLPPESPRTVTISDVHTKKSTHNNKISVCDVMKNNTSRVIKKMESQVPTYFQNYSDLYTAYLHSFDDIFGTCYIAEKQFFDKLGIDQNTLKTFENYSNSLANICTSQIDVSNNFLKAYVQMRTSQIESYDRYIHVMMDAYSKILSQYNSAFATKIGNNVK